MLDEFLHTLEHGPQYWAYALVVAAAAIEYVFPPVPGDTVALFAVALAVRAQLSWVFVYLSMTLGALLGGLAAWGFGLWLANHEESWPSFLRTPGATRALDAVRRGYERHGAMYLVVNRFLPALRAFFFVGAGHVPNERRPGDRLWRDLRRAVERALDGHRLRRWQQLGRAARLGRTLRRSDVDPRRHRGRSA